MENAGLTIEDMVQATGKSLATIYSWRQGRSGPTSKDRAGLVHLLGIDATTLAEVLRETKRQYRESLAKSES